MRIVSLEEQHCEVIAALHMQYLRTRFHGRAGQGLLSAYYAALAQNMGACGYVAEKEGQVVGYVCGVWDAHQVRRALIRKHGLSLILWGIILTLSSPVVLTRIFTRIRDRKEGASLPENGYELRPIVVMPSERGSGLATQLVSILMEDAHRRGYPVVHLFTEIDNHAANGFYPKVNFHLTGTLIRKGQTYNRYERSI